MLLNILRFTWPPSPCCLTLSIHTHDFDFQDPSLPDTVLVTAWRHWFCTLPRCSVFISDASKDNFKTSIAALDIHTNPSVAGLVPHSYTVFTTEVLAIYLALTSLSSQSLIHTS